VSRDDYDRDDRDERRPPTKKGGGGGLVLGLVLGLGALGLCLCGGVGVVIAFAYLRVGSAAERMNASNDLKQIGLAMHAYHDTYNALPPADGKLNGRPTLSWRVHILPFIEQDNLYRQFRLDEPWDSPENKRVLDNFPMPPTYAYGKPRPGQKTTPFRVFLGGGAAFERGKLTRFVGQDQNHIDFKDGTSNTLLVVEAADEVPWTKPDELEYGQAFGVPLPKLGGADRPGFLALLADGSVRFVSRSTSEQTLRGFITRSGGEMPGADW
jgi:hypothetical protein